MNDLSLMMNLSKFLIELAYDTLKKFSPFSPKDDPGTVATNLFSSKNFDISTEFI